MRAQWSKTTTAKNARFRRRLRRFKFERKVREIAQLLTFISNYMENLYAFE